MSCVVSKHNKENLSADTTKNVCRDDVHDCTPVYQGFTNMTIREENVQDRDPVRQGHVSAFPFTPFAIASESFASQLCLPTALTHGRVASSLCLCLCFCLCLCLSLSAGAGRAGQSPRRDSQALCLTSSGQVLVFLCDQLVSQQHISHLFV